MYIYHATDAFSVVDVSTVKRLYRGCEMREGKELFIFHTTLFFPFPLPSQAVSADSNENLGAFIYLR